MIYPGRPVSTRQPDFTHSKVSVAIHGQLQWRSANQSGARQWKFWRRERGMPFLASKMPMSLLSQALCAAHLFLASSAPAGGVQHGGQGWEAWRGACGTSLRGNEAASQIAPNPLLGPWLRFSVGDSRQVATRQMRLRGRERR